VYCESLGFAKFRFGLIPKLLISPGGSAIFFPDFPGAYSDVIFFGFRQSKRPHLQFFRQFQYPLGRFPVVNHPREAAVLFGLSENAGDEAFPVHGGPPQIRGPGIENGSTPLTTFAQYPSRNIRSAQQNTARRAFWTELLWCVECKEADS
jgi:hypothetical protein